MTGIEADILLTDEEILAAEARDLARWAEPDQAARARLQAEAEAIHAKVMAERAAQFAVLRAEQEARRLAALARRSPGFYWACVNRDGDPPEVVEWTEDGEWKLSGDDCWLPEYAVAKVYETRIEPPE
jgi:hypothetical protein